MIIYKITNKLNTKSYIGQTSKTLEIRWRRHCWSSEHTKNMPISKAIKKYGKENFFIEIITQCDSFEEANKLEMYYVNYFNTFSPYGYNLRAGGGNGAMSEETKQKISNANKGKKISLETRKKQSESHKGYVVKQETKEKLSKINKGKRPHKNTIEASSLANQKTYIVIFPDNHQEIITNMRQFCLKYKLSPSKMCNVAQGKRNHHHNFQVKYHAKT